MSETAGNLVNVFSLLNMEEIVDFAYLLTFVHPDKAEKLLVALDFVQENPVDFSGKI